MPRRSRREPPAVTASPVAGPAGGAAARGRRAAGATRIGGALGGAGRLPLVRPGRRPAVRRGGGRLGRITRVEAASHRQGAWRPYPGRRFPVRLRGRPPFPRRDVPDASAVPGTRRRTSERQMPHVPMPPPLAPALRPRRPLRVAPSGAHMRRPAGVALARRAKVAGTLRVATTSPAQPNTALAAGGRPIRAAVPLARIATARIAGRSGMAATTT